MMMRDGEVDGCEMERVMMRVLLGYLGEVIEEGYV